MRSNGGGPTLSELRLGKPASGRRGKSKLRVKSMIARFGTIATIAIWLLLSAMPGAQADKRVALVIGNSAYRNVAPLPNPVNDAAAIALLFQSAGFDSVELRRDVGISDMRRAVREFADKSQDADIAVVFYAGHGMEVDGVNYLVPVDAKLESDFDIEDEAMSLDRISQAIEPAAVCGSSFSMPAATIRSPRP